MYIVPVGGVSLHTEGTPEHGDVIKILVTLYHIPVEDVSLV